MLTDLEFKQIGPEHKLLSEENQQKLLAELNGWEIRSQDHAFLHRVFAFDDFQQALDFVNRIGALAEEVNHHPELNLSWGKVEVSWWTHSLSGLHLNDFILAAETDSLETSSK